MNVALQVSDECEVCGSAISFFEAINNRNRELAICGAVECLNVLRQKASMAAGAFATYLVSYRQVIEQRNQRLEIREQLKADERLENQRIFARLQESGDSQLSRPSHLVVIPTGHHQQVALKPERIEKYRAHLEDIISEAFAYSSVDAVPRDSNHESWDKLQEQEALFTRLPRLKQISDQFCALCKGGCCARGQEHGYLSASSMRRLLDADSSLTADQLLDAYLSRLAESSTVNACINQGPQGCVLPRELRSNTCNQFYCGSIKKYQSHVESDQDISTVAVIQREQSLWNRSYASESNEVTNVMIVTGHAVSAVSLITLGDVKALDCSFHELGANG